MRDMVVHSPARSLSLTSHGLGHVLGLSASREDPRAPHTEGEG